MASTEYANIIDPEVIEASIGNSWANELSLLKYAPQVFIRDTRPIFQGSLVSQVRNTIFQGTPGQAVGPTETISTVGRVQNLESHPVIWRDGGVDEDDIASEIMPKSGDVNAEYAEAAKTAAIQWLEDSIFAMVEGVGAALTSNQAGSGATATLALLVAGKAALADQGIAINGGASLMRSELYWKLVELGLIAATSNTFGNAAQDEMVRSGIMPSLFLGTMSLPSDKLSAAPGTDHYLYFLGPQSIVLRASMAPKIESTRKTALNQMGTIVLVQTKFALGAKGCGWAGTPSPKISDVDLQTSTNWALADSNSKYVKIARVLTDNN